MAGTRVQVVSSQQDSPGVWTGPQAMIKPSPSLPRVSTDDIPGTLALRDSEGSSSFEAVRVESVEPLSEAQSLRIPADSVVDLGNVEGNMELDLSLGNIFVGTVVDDTVFSVVGRQYGLVTMYFTQGNGGGHTVAFNGAGGLTIVDPFPFNSDIFPSKADGAESVSLWSAGGGNLYALGINATPIA